MRLSMTALRSVKRDETKMVDDVKKHKGLKLGVVAVMLLCGVCWAYVADYYHADDAVAAAMSPAAGVAVSCKRPAARITSEKPSWRTMAARFPSITR